MANPSLQIGNDNWAIKEDDLLGYSKAGTRFVPEPITMTRASAGTRVNPEGLVKTVGSLGSELVTNGDFSEIGAEEILNGDFSEEGVEIIPDGNFTNQAAVDYWQINNSRAIKTLGDGFMRLTYDLNVAQALYKNSILISGKSYKVTFRAKGTANNKFGSIGDNNSIQNNPQYAVSNPNLTTDWQDYEFYVPVTSTLLRLYLTGAIQVGQTLDITNISVKEVGQDWTPLGTNATNTINFEANGVRFISVDQNISISQYSVLEVGKIYKFTCDVVTTTGVIGVDGAITEEGTINMTNGFNEIYFTASSNTFKIKRVNAVTNCLLSNVSVKEVGQDWTLGGGWSISNGKLIGNNATGYALQGGVFESGVSKIYKITLTVSDYVSGYFTILTSGGTSQSQQFNANGDYAIYFNTNSPSGTTLHFTYFGSFTGSIDNVSVKEATVFDLARVDYTDGTSSLLVEPQRTNLITYSEDFSQYTNSDTTDTANTVTSPDGTVNGTTLTASGSGSLNHIITSPAYTIASGEITSSIFAKKGTVNYIRLRLNGTTGGERAWYNLNNGTIDGEDVSGSAKIEDYGNGWYRCSLTSSSNIASGSGKSLQIFIQDSGGSQTAWTANGTENIHIWGAQTEQGSYATSYIPTYGTTVTRLKDQYSKAGISNLINSEEGSFFVDIAALNQPPYSQISISLSGDNSNDRILIFTGSGGGEWNTQFRKDGSNIVNVKKSITITNQSKLAVSWKSGKYLMYIDGIKATNYTIGSETEATTFDAGDLKNLQFSPNHNSTSNLFHGKVKQLQVYKTALSDDELTILTGTSGVHFYPSYAAMASVLTYTIE